MLSKIILFALSVVMCISCQAAEQIGPVHPIIEPDMLQEIYRVLKEKERTGETAKLQQEAIERSKKSVESPRPVEGLTKVIKPRFFYWDPTVTVPKTIRDPSGNIIAEAGKRINPLDYVSLSKHLLFFDGNDPAQVEKALALIKHYNGLIKPILVAGRPLELMRQRKVQFFFDQGGALVRRLGIERVPSLVTQEGKKLRIDELETL